MRIMHLRAAPQFLAFWLIMIAAAGTVACTSFGNAVAEPPLQDQQIFIVRHAEKAAGDDPPLTEAGVARAHALADYVGDSGIDRIFSTDTRRTRSTAAPLATRFGLEIELYDHREPARLAQRVLASGESVLIVGHSNTIRGLAEAFGVRPGPAVREDEFDRIYVITPDDASHPARIVRYGQPAND